MNRLTIEKNKESCKITLQPKRIGWIAKAILFVVTLSAMLIPVYVLFTKDASQGQIIMAILSGFCAAFLIRLAMWNLFGKEIFEVSDQAVKHYIDYQFFKDTLYRSENKNQIAFHAIAQDTEKSASELLDSIPVTETRENFHLAISDNNSQLSQSNLYLSATQIKDVLDEILRLRNKQI